MCPTAVTSLLTAIPTPQVESRSVTRDDFRAIGSI
jgi:hypothetical protein